MNTSSAPATPLMSARQAYYYLQSLRSYTLPRKELEQLQLRKMKEVLRYLDRNDPACHERFKRVGLDPESVGRVEQIRLLPTMSRAEILKQHEEALASGRAKGARIFTTTGTTAGQQGVMVMSKKGRALKRALSLRKKIKFGLRPWSRVATLWAPERYWRKAMSDGAFRPTTGARTLPLGIKPPNLLTLWFDPYDPAKDGKTLADFKPEFVYGRPSHLRRIARSCGTGLGLRPRAIVAGGEIITDTGFKELRSTFGAKILRNYGASGFGGLGSDCIHETGLHTNEDYKVYEVLKDGEQVSEGEVGELVVTFLYPELVPVLRFRTGDYVRLGPKDRCECGSSSQRLIRVEGRDNDWIVGHDGEKFLSLDVANRMESEFGLRDFRLVQRSTADFTLLVGKDGIANSSVPDVRKYLEGLTQRGINLEVEERTEEDYWMKTRPVECQIR